MKKAIILFIILVLIAVSGIIFQSYRKNGISFLKSPKATINNHYFNLTVVKTLKETQVGLSEKKSLDQNSGMFFVFEGPAFYSFWMKNMKFPIDIIFIKGDKIVTIYENVNPPKTINESLSTYKPEEPADKVLEINAGLSKKYNIKKGNTVKIENL
ncbi:MAG: hypothetical protein A3H79_03395 [Candidatus Levybacteria bacterium RIFCSPLOWO2_02_FULL_36_8b]|nr:MAG: hypothetical protein A3H79_03395 [Candidatus Levybacteria bacterium RIFCSPLOWO2_02_FULL_36_8b]